MVSFFFFFFFYNFPSIGLKLDDGPNIMNKGISVLGIADDSVAEIEGQVREHDCLIAIGKKIFSLLWTIYYFSF